MPLSVCPNCQTPMAEVNRRGVYVDICTKCRGVWLDGGELEKLLATADAGAEAAADSRRYASHERYHEARRDEDPGHDGVRRRKRRGGGVFEIFEDLFD